MPKAEDIVAFEEYKRAKREVKKAISKARGEALDGLFQKLGTREGEKEFKLARLREKKGKDLNQVKCIRDDSQQVLA